MQDRNIGRLLLTLQLILLCQIWWHMEICHAEAFPAAFLRVADFARGTSKNKFISVCDHPFHSWMCTTSVGKSLIGNQRLTTAENNQSQVSFRTPKTVTPSTLVVTLPPHYFPRTEAPNFSNFNSLPMQVLPPNYSYEVDPNYDMCSHPFHAWLCDRSTQKERSDKPSTNPKPKDQSQEPLVITTTKPPTTQLSKEYFFNPPQENDPKEVAKESSHFSNQLLVNNFKVQKSALSPSTPVNNNRCKHPFHSWLCYNNAKAESKLRSNVIIPINHHKVPKPILPKQDLVILPIIQSNVEKNGSSRCTHAFHSWICRSSATIPVAPPVAKSLLPDTQIAHPSKVSPKAHPSLLPTSHNCKHAFHSWLCPQTTQRVPVKSISATSLKPKLIKSFHSDGSGNFVTTRSPPSKSTVATPDVNKCNHAFHSWLCPKSSQPIQVKSSTAEPSNRGRNLIIKISQKAPPADRPQKNISRKPSVLQTSNPCTHAFHSWLCPQFKTKEPKSPIITTIPPRLSKNLHPHSSNANSQKCNHAFHSWLCATPKQQFTSKPTTIRTTTSTTTSTTPLQKQGKSIISNSFINIATQAPSPMKTSKSSENDYHKCNHAFHSWLCATPKQQTTPKPTTISTTPSTITTTTSPLQKQGKSIISNSLLNIATQAPIPIKASPSAKNDSHKCNHAFHSWLCATPKRITTTPIPKLEKSLIPLNSLNAPVTPPPVPRPANGSNHKCNHAFHSWLCQEPSKTRKIALDEEKQNTGPKQSQQVSILSLPKSTSDSSHLKKDFDCNDPNAIYNSLYLSKCQINKTTPSSTSTERTSTTTVENVLNGKSFDSPVENNFFKISTVPTATVKIPKSNSWEGTNPCSHAFHAWLCQPLRPKLTQPPFSPPRHSPNFVLNHLTNTGKILIPTLRPAETLAPTVKAEQLESRNFPIINTNNKEKHDGDKCSHAFHSFLCNKSSPKVATTSAVAKPPTEIPVSKSFFESRSSDVQIVSKTGDPCSHPFHSWLCFSFDHRKSSLSLDQIPNVMLLPLENEKVRVKVEDSPRNARRIKASDQNLLINLEKFDDTIVEELAAESNETVLVEKDDTISEDELDNKFDFKLDPFYEYLGDNSTLQPAYRTTQVQVNTIKPPLYISPRTFTVNKVHKYVDSSRSKNEMESSFPTVSTPALRNLPDYDDWSDPMVFESKRTIPRKINK